MGLRAAVAGLLKHQVYIEHGVGGVGVITLWTFKAGAVTEARRTQEQGAIRTWLGASWAPITNTQWKATAIKTWDFTTNPPTKLTSELIVPNINGTEASGISVPPSVVAVVALRTQPLNSSVRNRNNGRLAHRGVSTVSATGAITNPTVAAIDAAYEALLTALKTATQADRGNWSVVSFRSAGAWRVVPVVTAINHTIVRTQPGTQRRSWVHAGPYARGA